MTPAAELGRHGAPGDSGHPAHHGGSDCSAPEALPQILSEAQPVPGAEAASPLALADRPPAATATALHQRSGRPLTDRSGRSTLTSVCRWRV
ncbi:hypothetical protein [Streptomyces sp. NPDC020141]|uniref:hypothetical protein n=1 Tax=Streptomyces sp. NPDC020141 TaxID=3365065 RepID=UPI0037A8DBBD